VIVVSDASPLLNLAIIGQLDLLRQLYDEVVVPQAVYDEVVVLGSDMPGASDVRDAHWILTKQVMNRPLITALRLRLDRGEAEAIALASELNADLLLVDERKARLVASQFGLKFTGLLGLLVEAKQKRMIVAVKPLVDRLRTEAGFWISQNLYEYILQVVNEAI
jgi:uncharacterized protein